MAQAAKKPAEKLDSRSMSVKVFSPYQVYYEGPAQSLSAVNDTGPFDILPKHHNFMTLVNEGEITIRVEGSEDKRLRISKGVLHARHNMVTVFLDV